MKNIQNEIDQLSRQQLTLDLLSCVLRNQIYGLPARKAAVEGQKDILTKCDVEIQRIEKAVDRLLEERRRNTL